MLTACVGGRCDDNGVNTGLLLERHDGTDGTDRSAHLAGRVCNIMMTHELASDICRARDKSLPSCMSLISESHIRISRPRDIIYRRMFYLRVNACAALLFLLPPPVPRLLRVTH